MTKFADLAIFVKNPTYFDEMHSETEQHENDAMFAEAVLAYVWLAHDASMDHCNVVDVLFSTWRRTTLAEIAALVQLNTERVENVLNELEVDGIVSKGAETSNVSNAEYNRRRKQDTSTEKLYRCVVRHTWYVDPDVALATIAYPFLLMHRESDLSDPHVQSALAILREPRRYNPLASFQLENLIDTIIASGISITPFSNPLGAFLTVSHRTKQRKHVK